MKKNKQLTFADLFSGIGGFRLGLEQNGFKCVFSADNDEHACKMYKANYNADSLHDVTKMSDDEIKHLPNFDVLTAGFPCQSFSISGKKKGFLDETRGTLFFEVLRFLSIKKPHAFILENVKHLIHHNHGKTFTIMIDSLNELGYTVRYKVLNAKNFGVPQNRERIVIIGTDNGVPFDFSKLELHPTNSMNGFLDKEGDFEYLNPTEYTLIPKDRIKRQKSDLIFVGYRNKKIRTKGVREGTNYLSRVHKMPNRIYSSDGVNPTISSQESSGRYFILTPTKRVRKLTLAETYRFMGFPDDFKKVGSVAKLYNRIGNSVCVPMITSIGKVLKATMNKKNNQAVSDPSNYLEKIYKLAISDDGTKIYKALKSKDKENIDIIVDKEKSLKGLYTVLITSLTYKALNPEQDIRYHKKELPGGYSGRSFDTKYVTPFLKQKRFRGAMKESGWLTRSLEQPEPFTFEFPGRINSKQAKEAFLDLLDHVEKDPSLAQKYLISLFNQSYIAKSKEEVTIVNPVESESDLKIDDIMFLLEKHFNYKNYRNGTRGNSILPVIALYSIYQCLIKQMKRYEGKYLSPRMSHYSSDSNSGETGDIVVRDNNDNIYEVVEVKSGILITPTMINDAYNKFKSLGEVQRYYILSTETPDDELAKNLKELCDKIYAESGTQIICNGLIKTLNYYLRLLDNTNEFILNYTHNLEIDPELNAEHKVSWNLICNEFQKKHK